MRPAPAPPGTSSELALDNPAGEASRGREQSAGYARRGHFHAIADAGSIPAVSTFAENSNRPPHQRGAVLLLGPERRERAVEEAADVGGDELESDCAEEGTDHLSCSCGPLLERLWTLFIRPHGESARGYDVPGRENVVANHVQRTVGELQAVGHRGDAERADRLGPGADDPRGDSHDQPIGEARAK